MMETSFQEHYQKRLAQVEAHLKASFPTLAPQVEILSQAMGYSLFAGGKRLRPILLLTTLEAAGKPVEPALDLACALEYIHTYSLIHDDLPCMDDDDLRRGLPTNHIRFGEDMALLAGDALQTHAFALACRPVAGVDPAVQLQGVKVLAEKAGVFGMVAGQVADIKQEGQVGDAQVLSFVHRHKTGQLIVAAVELGGLLAGVRPAALAELVAFGEALGTCFQIQDDILDETGNQEALGKPVGSDQKNQKLTYPSLYGLERSRQLAEEAYQKALQHLEASGLAPLRLRQLADFVLRRDR